MTKEDAVAILSEIRSDYNFFNTREEPEYRAMSMAIEALKATQWIPCSERLPEQDGEYLVTAISNMRTLPFIMITSFFKDSNYGKNHWHTGWSKSEVIAWMPLPEPYKENES